MNRLLLSIILLFSYCICNAQCNEELYITETGDYFYINDGYAEYRLGRTIGGGEIIIKKRTLYAVNDAFYTGGLRSSYEIREFVNDSCNSICINLYNQDRIKIDSLQTIITYLFSYGCIDGISKFQRSLDFKILSSGQFCICIDCLPQDSILYIGVLDAHRFYDALLIEHKHNNPTEYDVFLFSESYDSPKGLMKLNSCYHKLEFIKTNEGKLHAIKFLDRCSYRRFLFFYYRIKNSLDIDIILKPVPEDKIEEVKLNLPLRANL